MPCDILRLQLELKFFGANKTEFWKIKWEKKNLLFFLQIACQSLHPKVVVSVSWKDCWHAMSFSSQTEQPKERKEINQGPEKLTWETELGL